MPDEHAIRLRAGWEVHIPGESDGSSQRLGLPLDWEKFPWPSGRPAPRIQLRRRFGRPLNSGSSTSLARLVLKQAAGVLAIKINGQTQPWRIEEPETLIVDSLDLAPRNLLVIEMVPPKELQGRWGEVAIVFHETA